MRMHWWIAGLLVLGIQAAPAQSVRSLVNDGNDLYKDKKFTDAEVNYRKALEKEKGLVQGHFNLGNALAKQGKNDEAQKEFEAALEKAQQMDTKAYARYNIGNTQMAEQNYADAARSYVEALKLNPHDEEAKYNLSYALEKMRQQQRQQQQQNQQNNKNKDQNKQQDQKNKQQQDKNKQDQNRQQKPDPKQDQQQQQQAQQQQKRMSKADADRILEVLKNSEKDVQKKLRTRPAERPKTDKDW